MAQDRREIEYRTQGSAAYDPSFYVGEESTVRQAPEPKAAPKPRPRRKQPVARQKMTVSPFAPPGHCGLPHDAGAGALRLCPSL